MGGSPVIDSVTGDIWLRIRIPTKRNASRVNGGQEDGLENTGEGERLQESCTETMNNMIFIARVCLHLK
jgi:hypothetical protein